MVQREGGRRKPDLLSRDRPRQAGVARRSWMLHPASSRNSHLGIKLFSRFRDNTYRKRARAGDQ